MTTIESEAFQGCTGLTSVTIGNSVTSIGYDAFKDCSNISSITFHCKEIGNWFSDWSVRNSVRSVIIGEEVTTIGDYAFNYFGGLTNITIPNSVASIGKYAFHECSGLTSVIIPNGVQAIGENTFSHCSALTSVTIPNSVTSIGKGAFLNCTGLTSITIPNSVIQIGESAFYGCSNLESITIPNSVTSIGSTAFKNCSSLKSINIPNNINEIKYNTFYGCKELERITIPNSITKIGESAFYGCSGLTRVDYSSIEHLCSIEFVNVHSNPLYYARHLYINGEELKDNLVVPESITSIGIGAFNGCILKNVMVKHQTPPTSDAQTFSVQTLYHATLYVPTGTWESYAYDDAWYTFINIRETATETAELSGRHAYTLMDAKSFAYMVYDPVNGGMNSIASTAIDENNPNHCWQTITVDGQRYLYNIGAKKFAQLSPDGKSLTFTENVASIEMTDGEDGLLFGSQQGRQWAMVTNDKTAVDDSVIEGVVTSVAMKNANEKKPQSLSTT